MMHVLGSVFMCGHSLVALKFNVSWRTSAHCCEMHLGEYSSFIFVSFSHYLHTKSFAW